MSRVVAVVVREDEHNDLTTIERVFEGSLFNSARERAIRYVEDQRIVYPGVEFFIEEMPVY